MENRIKDLHHSKIERFFWMNRIIKYNVILILLSLGGCHQQTYFSDLKVPYFGQEPPEMTPEIFAPGIISTAFQDIRITFSPDLAECYFCTAYQPNDSVFKVTTLVCYNRNGEWTYPEVAFFTGKYEDQAPCIHPDGSILIFQSDRPFYEYESKNKWNLWIMKKEHGKWSDPSPMNQHINGKGNVFGPSIANNGNLYFTRELGVGSQIIMRSEFKDDEYQEPIKLPKEINSVKSQFDAAIAPDESYIIVPVYGRKDAVGSADYYVSFRDENDRWTELINLGETINTRNVESGPYISPDGKYLFFQSYGFDSDTTQSTKKISFSDLHRMLNTSDIYWISTDYIKNLKLN